MSCIQEEKEREEHLYGPPPPPIISERGPQTPSMFPPPSPYTSSEHSLELAAPTFLHPESLEMGPPREGQAQVCFKCTLLIVVYIFCVEFCLTVPWFTGCMYTTYTVVLMCNVLIVQ